jgi:hypothetical protein
MKKEDDGNITKFRFLPIGTKLILCSFFISIAAGKWGSYIGIPSMNIFLPDVLLIIGCILAALNQKKIQAQFTIYGIASISFFCFQFLRNSEYSVIIRIRDLIPFIYLLLVPFVFKSFAGLDKAIFVKTLRYASLFHLFWQVPIMIGVLSPIEVGGIFGYPIFSPRWDHDGIALILGVIAWRRYLSLNLNENNLISVLMGTVLIVQYSRAALIAFLFTLTLFYFRHLKDKEFGNFTKSYKLAFVSAYLIVTILIALPLIKNYVPSDSVISRIGLITNSENSQKAQQAATGTANARLYAQTTLFNWVKDRQQLFLGVGPGVEMVRDSGAVLFLSGSLDVRSPHSWFYGLVCSFGYLGAFVWGYLIFAPLIKSRAIFHPLDFPLIGIYPILISSLFGVIIEAPFGILPLVILISISRIS